MEKLRILLENLNYLGKNNKIFSLVALLLVFCALYAGMNFLYMYLVEGEVIKRQLDRLYRRMDASEKIRIASDKRNREGCRFDTFSYYSCH
jgi:hypothetical protein